MRDECRGGNERAASTGCGFILFPLPVLELNAEAVLELLQKLFFRSFFRRSRLRARSRSVLVGATRRRRAARCERPRALVHLPIGRDIVDKTQRFLEQGQRRHGREFLTYPRNRLGVQQSYSSLPLTIDSAYPPRTTFAGDTARITTFTPKARRPRHSSG